MLVAQQANPVHFAGKIPHKFNKRAPQLQSIKANSLTKNNFDLLRLLFAGTVCLVHAYELSGFSSLRLFSDYLSSAIAVKAFFVVSGFLIFMSYDRSKSLENYFNKRFRRIYPGYFTVVIACAIGMLTISSLPPQEYFSLQWAKYVISNLTFLNFIQPSLPGVFDTNKVNAVNGALWTLKIEVMFYLIVPLIAAFAQKFNRMTALIIIYIASILYAKACNTLYLNTENSIYLELGRQLPGQLSYFIGGAIIYYHLEQFTKKKNLFLCIAAIATIINTTYSTLWLEPLSLAVIVIYFGIFFYAGNFGKYGDFSYGVYILHFPLIQITLLFSWSHESEWKFLVFIISITLLGAALLWHCVEKNFLLRNNHYISNR